MFDCVDEVATTGQLCARITANHARLVETECEELVLAAAWADSHYRDLTSGDWQPVVQQASAWGGDGCPPVSEHCAHEFGALRGVGSHAAKLFIGDALDIRYRLPRLWALVRTGSVRAWQARKIAQATHHLSWEAAGEVDRNLCGFLPQLGWPRFQRLLETAVLEADPEQRRQREQAAREQRGVWSWAGEHGLSTIVARAASGDARWFMATIDRIADILRLDGDLDPVDLRRSRAIAILAQPARAVTLLLAHTGDPDTGPTTTQSTTDATAAPDDASDLDPDDDLVDDLDESGESDEPDLGGQPDPSLDLSPAGLAGLSAHDVARLRPRVVLHLHLTDTALRCGDGLVRPEHGDALTLAQLHEWLADTGCQVSVRPVGDPADTGPVDAYETPFRLRDALHLRNPVDTFPYGTATSRTLDLDHTTPYVFGPTGRDGPPGQTGLHNLGPLTRHHHNAITHGGWRRHQPDPGTYFYRSPNGYLFLVTNHGTLRLGKTAFTDALWRAATGDVTGPDLAAA